MLRGGLSISTVLQPNEQGILPANALGELLLGVLAAPNPARKLAELKAGIAPFQISLS